MTPLSPSPPRRFETVQPVAERRDEINVNQIQDPRTKHAVEYWKRIRGDRAMPSRAEIDPLELRQCLGWICLVDVLREPERLRFRYRVYGSGLADICGRELTGHHLDEPGSDDGRDMLPIYQQAVETSSPLFDLRQREFRKGTYLLESAVLPLSDSGSLVSGLMDVTVPVESWRVLLGSASGGGGWERHTP